MTNKIYAIIGPHASGKTMLIQHLKRLGLPYILSYTTRKPKADEKNGEDYHFVDKETFFKLDLIEKVTYRGEYYGLSKLELLKTLQTCNRSIILLEANGLKQLTKLLSERIESIYIMADYVTLVERMLMMKESNDDIKHNLEYAENNGEFETWKVTTHVVKNVLDPNIAVDQILSFMGLMDRKKINPLENSKNFNSKI